MKVFSISGCSIKERDLCVQKVSEELMSRGHSVGILKEIPESDQTGDLSKETKEFYVDILVERKPDQTTFRVPGKISIDTAVSFCKQDYVIIVGDVQINAPKIICITDKDQIAAKPDDGILAYCAYYSDKDCIEGIPIFDCTNQIDLLSDIIQEKVYERLPYLGSKGCRRCGKSCTEMAIDIVRGKASRKDCALARDRVKVMINEKELILAPFVGNIVESVIKGLLSSLKGYEEGRISITISKHNTNNERRK